MTEETTPRKSPNFPQKTPPQEQFSGPNFSLARIGGAETLGRYAVKHPLLGQFIPGKVFLQELLGLTGMEISMGILPGEMSLPFSHRHQQNEEVYLFLNGQGQFRVDEQILDITPGTAIRVSPAGVRCVRNTSAEPMFYIVIQAKEGSLEQWTATDGVGVPGPFTWPDHQSA